MAASQINILGCIPARFDSSRLPGKPLADIQGKPLILHVCEKAKQCKNLTDFIVLTDDERILKVVEAAGYQAAMTNKECLNGTLRIIDYLPNTDAEILLNIQGDELLLNPKHIDKLIAEFCEEPNRAMGTLAHEETDKETLQDPGHVKVVCDNTSHALYFSRQCIPLKQNGELPDTALIHQGIYIYARGLLEHWQNLAPSALEQTEHLEQLRPLENGILIHVTVVEDHQTLSIDTPADLAKAQTTKL